MDTAQIDEIERLLLDDVVVPDPIASMKASIDTLVGTVKEIAHKSALQAPQPGAPSTSAASNPATIEQLNRADFDNTEYHATFDPIAAAQGEQRNPISPSRSRGEIQPIGVIDTFQPGKRSEHSPKRKGSAWIGTTTPSKHQGPYSASTIRSTYVASVNVACLGRWHTSHYLV
uniref:Integrase core domain containing protein n=1 Tax=Haemonchus contortus TaxID=6289 RepID=A0A7I5ECR6_HAECO